MPDVGTTLPGPKFTSNEQAEGWAKDLVSQVREARAHCDLETLAANQRKWHHKLLIRYGSAKGVLDALYRCGKINENFYAVSCEYLLIAIAVKVTDADNQGATRG